MNTANSEPMDTSMRHSTNPSARKESSHETEPELLRKTKESY